MAAKRRRPSQRGQKASGLKSWSTKEKGELFAETRERLEKKDCSHHFLVPGSITASTVSGVEEDVLRSLSEQLLSPHRLTEAEILSFACYHRMTSAQRHGSNYIIQARNTRIHPLFPQLLLCSSSLPPNPTSHLFFNPSND